jgi:hypothetical protein
MITLRTQTLPEVANGLLAEVLDHALAEIHQDITDRPKVKQPRKVILELILKPADSGEDIVDAVDVQFTVDTKKPKTSMKRRMASFPRKNSLGFETDTNKVTHAPNQRKLPVSAEEGELGAEFDSDKL